MKINKIKLYIYSVIFFIFAFVNKAPADTKLTDLTFLNLTSLIFFLLAMAIWAVAGSLSEDEK